MGTKTVDVHLLDTFGVMVTPGFALIAHPPHHQESFTCRREAEDELGKQPI